MDWNKQSWIWLLSYPTLVHQDLQAPSPSNHYLAWSLSLKCFPDSSVGKESAYNAGDPSSIPRSGRSTGQGIGYPLRYSWASLVAQLVQNPPAMWETWVQSQVWDNPLRRERLSTPVFWPGEFHVLYSSWCDKELDMIEWLSLHWILY